MSTPHGDPIGAMNLAELMPAWSRLDQVVQLWHSADEAFASDTTTLTARRFDESQPGGQRTYIQASSLLNVALDNLGALRHLITTLGATIWAPWTLLRSVFESSAWVCWLLEPEDGAERRRRGVRRAVLDQREWRNFAREWAITRADRDELADRDAKLTAVYRSEADACGLSWPTANQKVNLADELLKLDAIARSMIRPPTVAVGLWRSLSGMTHGFAYAAQNNAEITASVPIPGGQRVTYVVNDTNFEVHAMVSMSLLVSGIATYVRRTQVA